MPGAAVRALFSFLLLLALGISTATAPCQTVSGQEPKLEPTTVKALERLAGDLDAARKRRDAAVEAADQVRIETLDVEILGLSWQFAGLASRIDVQEFELPTKPKFELQTELEQLVRPLLQTIKDATKEPRQISSLKERIANLRARRERAANAQQATTRTRNLLPSDSQARREADREIRERWLTAVAGLDGQILILEAQLVNMEEGKQPLLEQLSKLKDTGLSLLLCGLVFFTVLFSLRWLQSRVLTRRLQDRAVSVRVLEVLLGALGLIVAIGATLVVPYVRQEWLLLSIGIVFLVGAGWVLVRMLPQFFEQIRLVLNIGAVREGERLILDGLPYRVESLRFYTQLVNPDLQGGSLRVPIQDLIGRRSRQADPDEPWFPSRVGDVVLLGDDVIGPVTAQTPELVVVDDYRAPRTYTATAFLAEQPRNLSRGFAVITTFGIDYRHQADATGKIPEVLTEALRCGLTKLVAEELIVQVQVQFEAANRSSLDFEARADFDGGAALQYRELRRALQRILVDACSENGWTIPLPQLTLHQASD